MASEVIVVYIPHALFVAVCLFACGAKKWTKEFGYQIRHNVNLLSIDSEWRAALARYSKPV